MMLFSIVIPRRWLW